jgi:hypothetical protein
MKRLRVRFPRWASGSSWSQGYFRRSTFPRKRDGCPEYVPTQAYVLRMRSPTSRSRRCVRAPTSRSGWATPTSRQRCAICTSRCATRTPPSSPRRLRSTQGRASQDDLGRLRRFPGTTSDVSDIWPPSPRHGFREWSIATRFRGNIPVFEGRDRVGAGTTWDDLAPSTECVERMTVVLSAAELGLASVHTRFIPELAAKTRRTERRSTEPRQRCAKCRPKARR